MDREHLSFLRRMQAIQRAFVGASRPLPFIYIDFVLDEAFMDSQLVSVAAAYRAAERLTDEQFQRAAQRCVVMVVLVLPAEDSPRPLYYKTAYLDPRFASLPQSPVIVLYSSMSRAAR